MTQAKPTTRETAADPSVQAVFRRAAWVAAAVATGVGLFGLILPTTALTVVALLIGVYLIVSGIMRISTAFSAHGVPTGWRWLLGLVGGLVVVAGIIVLNNPIGTMVAVVIVTGIGWIIDGIGYLVAAVGLRKSSGPSSIALGIAGALLIVAGILVLVVPSTALASLLLLLCILLLVVGVLSLAGLAIARTRSARTTR